MKQTFILKNARADLRRRPRMRRMTTASSSGLRVVRAVRRVWSEASAMEVEHERIRKLAEHAAVEEARQPDGSVRTSLKHSVVPDVELVGVTLSPSNVLHSLTFHDAVPVSTAEQLLSHVLAGGRKPMARAALRELCVAVAAIGEEALASEFGKEVAGAAMTVALGRPRPGHSVLGQGTFRAAAPAWAVLAERHALSSEAQEVRMYRAAGLSELRIEQFADTSEEGIAQSGGTVAWLAFPGGFG
eukprot:scaffold35958_cov146-Isochrysis_galbana.AAC.1